MHFSAILIKNAVIEAGDADTLYHVPITLQAQNLDQLTCDHFGLDCPPADMTEWNQLINQVKNLEEKATIALVGKYVELPDAYISVVEALKHAGYSFNADVEVKWVNSEFITSSNVQEQLQDADGILVPGGFGDRGIEGKIEAIRYAREHRVPFLGICLGMQLATVEFARNVLGLNGAHSAEINPSTPHPIIDLLPEQKEVSDLGGTLRLGIYPSRLKEGSRALEAYGEEVIYERHRHRFEFNNHYRDQMEAAGFNFSGTSPDGRLIEIIEVEDHPWFVASQFHPEFKSRPTRPQELFYGFVGAAMNQK